MKKILNTVQETRQDLQWSSNDLKNELIDCYSRYSYSLYLFTKLKTTDRASSEIADIKQLVKMSFGNERQLRESVSKYSETLCGILEDLFVLMREDFAGSCLSILEKVSANCEKMVVQFTEARTSIRDLDGQNVYYSSIENIQTVKQHLEKHVALTGLAFFNNNSPDISFSTESVKYDTLEKHGVQSVNELIHVTPNMTKLVEMLESIRNSYTKEAAMDTYYALSSLTSISLTNGQYNQPGELLQKLLAVFELMNTCTAYLSTQASLTYAVVK